MDFFTLFYGLRFLWQINTGLSNDTNISTLMSVELKTGVDFKVKYASFNLGTGKVYNAHVFNVNLYVTFVKKSTQHIFKHMFQNFRVEL